MRAWAGAFALACATTIGGAAFADEECARECMSAGLDHFLQSMSDNNPDAAPVSEHYRGTENLFEVSLGEGLWSSARGLGPLQRRFIDEQTSQAAFYGVVMEDAGGALLSLRVKFDGRLIAESEAIIAREGEPLHNISDAITYQPRPAGPLPESMRVDRNTLVAVADGYFDGLRDNTGGHIPKIDGCERVENGTKVTHRERHGATGQAGDEHMSGDCTAGFERMTGIAEVAYRRFPVADTEAGVVLGVGLFHRPEGAKASDGSLRKRNLIHEYFATEGGAISEIFAVMRYIDYDAPDSTGWPNSAD